MAGVSVVISATDAATGVIGKVNSRLAEMNKQAAAVRAPLDRLAGSLGRFGQISGISQAASDMRGLGGQIAGATASLGRFAPALGALTSAASIAGMASLVERWTAFGSRLGFDAQRINMTASGLQSLQGAAKLAGSSAEALTSGMQTLGDNLTNAVAGRSPETVQMLSTLGLSFRDAATGGARLSTDVLPEIADKIAAIHNPTQQAIVATTLFGAAGESLLPFLRRGAAGIADYNAQAAKYGLLNDRAVAAANAMREAQTKMQLAIDGVGYSISERVAPVLVPLLLEFSDWIAAHREDISRFFGDIAQRFKEWVDSDGPKRLVAQIERVSAGVQGVVEKVGGWTNVFEVIGGAIALKMLSPLISVIAVVGRLTTALTIGLVEAFAKAGVAARLFNTETMKLPVFRVMALAMGVMDSVSGGIQADQLAPEQRRPLGIPDGANAAPNGPGAPAGGSDSGGVGGWFHRHLPSWLGGSSSNAPTLPPEDQKRLGLAAMNQLIGLGRTPQQAAGIVASLGRESGFRTNAVGDNGQALGIAQWHSDRRSAIEQHFGKPVSSMSFQEQVEAADWELKNRETAANAALNRTRTAAEAGDAISRGYERPADVEGEASARARLAAGWEAQWNEAHRAAAPAPLAPPAATLPALAGAGGAQGQPGPDGKATVRLTFDNPPVGMRTSTVSQGGLRVETPSLGLSP